MRRIIQTEPDQTKEDVETAHTPDGTASDVPPSRETEDLFASRAAQQLGALPSSFQQSSQFQFNQSPAGSNVFRNQSATAQYSGGFGSIATPPDAQSANSAQPGNLFGQTPTNQSNPGQILVSKGQPTISGETLPTSNTPFASQPSDGRQTMNNFSNPPGNSGFGVFPSNGNQVPAFSNDSSQATNAPQTSAFGVPNLNNAQQTSAFAAQNTQKTSIFGGPRPNNAQQTPAFGSSAPQNSSFGQPNTGFGNAPQNSGFGAPNSNNAPQASVFGTPSPGLGASNSRNVSQNTPFGTPNFGFGAPSSNNPQLSGFGASSSSSGPQPSGFGASSSNSGPQPSGFGVSTPDKTFQNSPFGAQNSVFGSANPNSGPSLFSGFGPPQSTFGNRFGQLPQQHTGGIFGPPVASPPILPIANPLPLASQQKHIGGHYEYGNQMIFVNNIASLPVNSHESLEELRIKSRMSRSPFTFPIPPNSIFVPSPFKPNPVTIEGNKVGIDLTINHILMFGGALFFLPNGQFAGILFMLLLLVMKIYNLRTINLNLP